MIDREKLVRRHNPVLSQIDTESPMTVGNGEFAFTADITGLQSLYDEYEPIFPLCTMSQWGWHTTPNANPQGCLDKLEASAIQIENPNTQKHSNHSCANAGGAYTLDDVDMTRYSSGSRFVEYAVECKQGNEEIYNWLRHNPHRLNLARISLIWNDGEISATDVSDVRQELDLFTGALQSGFSIGGIRVKVTTVCSQSDDIVGFRIISDALSDGRLKAEISFPYGSHSMSASDWQSEACHETLATETEDGLLLQRTLDSDQYFVRICGKTQTTRTGVHSFALKADGGELCLTVTFSEQKQSQGFSFDEAYADSVNGWRKFWQSGGAADFSRSKDSRAPELERRAVLSQYLTAVHCGGSIPPQETGLACNSWYGKFHLEMHILHSAWFPLWNRSEILEKSFDWYLQIMDKAKENAARNGFDGARWPKMVGPGGVDSPSRIATLLIWQQPHILYMLELSAQSKPVADRIRFMQKHMDIVRHTADFMASFASINRETGEYELPPPLIPAQEEYAPETVRNPTFELCYWRFGLGLAVSWAKKLDEPYEQWQTIYDGLASPTVTGGLYPSHQSCVDTFVKYNRDHPSMLYAYGFIPCDRIDREIMSRTFDEVMRTWDFDTSWGWDFALMAMTLTRLGRTEDAIDILLMDAAKNSYVESGNNYQRSRNDLPLYLPGNGSLLLALAMMLAGYDGQESPGIPKNGMWQVEFEGISPLPY